MEPSEKLSKGEKAILAVTVLVILAMGSYGLYRESYGVLESIGRGVCSVCNVNEEKSGEDS